MKMTQIELETDQILRLLDSLVETEIRLKARHTADIDAIEGIKSTLQASLTRASAATSPAGVVGPPILPTLLPGDATKLAQVQASVEADAQELEDRLTAAARSDKLAPRPNPEQPWSTVPKRR